jgi:hypothetical protein
LKILDQNFFYAAKIGFEFEFMSSFRREEIANKIGEDLGKKVKVFRRYHSKFSPTRDVFKLEPDFSGGLRMVELVTGPMDYFEAIPVLIRILKWIDENGYTNEKCAFQFSISFDRNKYPSLVDFKTLNPLKFVLGFDEDFIWNKFPERRGSLYAKSIKRITPNNKFIRNYKDNLGDRNSYSVFTEKNMGVNLTKLKDGYLEVRYLGGTDYQKKYTDVKEIIDYVIDYTFRCLLQNDTLTQKETSVLSELVNNLYKETETFLDPESFMTNYPDFHFTVDLREDLQIIKTYFPEMKEILYSLIVDNQITKGFLNYDTQIARYQLKDGETKRANIIKDLDLIECKIEGNISRCRLFGCELKNCQVEDSNLVMNNDVYDSKITDCDLPFSNKIMDSYIDSKEKEISCEIDGGIIRTGYITVSATISPETEVISDSADSKGKGKGKGKGDKMVRAEVFPDRNYSDFLSAKNRFDNLNDKRPSYSSNKILNNNNI